MCGNNADSFMTNEAGVVSGDGVTAFQIEGTASFSGVSAAVAESQTFQTAFIAGVASTTGVSASSIAITGVSTSSRRRLSEGVSINYIIFAASPTVVRTIASTPVTSAVITAAVSQAYAGSADISSLSASVENTELFHLGTASARCAADQVIETEAECQAALAYLGTAASEGGIRWNGRRGHSGIPRGCSTRLSDKAAHFNSHATGNKGRADLTPICSGHELYHVGKAGGRCQSDQAILSEAECLTALAYIENPNLNQLHWDYRNGKGHPRGCNFHAGNSKVLFNRKTRDYVKNTVAGLTPLCKGAGGPETGRD
jgi:hypothetical protein